MNNTIKLTGTKDIIERLKREWTKYSGNVKDIQLTAEQMDVFVNECLPFNKDASFEQLRKSKLHFRYRPVKELETYE